MTVLPDKNKDEFRKILNRDLLEQPSAQFADSVLNKVGLKPSPAFKYEPVISVKGWIGIGVLIVFLSCLGLFGNNTSTTGIDKFTDTLHTGTAIIQNFTAGSFTALLTLAAMAVLILLTADSVYRRSRLTAI